MKIDLHIHTTYSDGTFSPEMVIDTALDCNLDVIALTDHDNILSHKAAYDYVQKNNINIEIIPGVEINTIYKGYEVHILGYFMNTDNADFQNLMKTQQQARINQTNEIIELLNKKAGIRIKFEDVKSLVAEGGSIGRPHIARAITNAGGGNNVMEAYAKYINDSSNVYVQRKTVSPHEACEIIYEAGGIPVFAHPIDVEISDELAKELISYGLRGIEAYHRKHSPAVVEHYSSLAEKYGLIITGGAGFFSPHLKQSLIFMGKKFFSSWGDDELIKEKRRLELL